MSYTFFQISGPGPDFGPGAPGPPRGGPGTGSGGVKMMFRDEIYVSGVVFKFRPRGGGKTFPGAGKYFLAGGGHKLFIFMYVFKFLFMRELKILTSMGGSEKVFMKGK